MHARRRRLKRDSRGGFRPYTAKHPPLTVFASAFRVRQPHVVLGKHFFVVAKPIFKQVLKLSYLIQ